MCEVSDDGSGGDLGLLLNGILPTDRSDRAAMKTAPTAQPAASGRFAVSSQTLHPACRRLRRPTGRWDGRLAGLCRVSPVRLELHGVDSENFADQNFARARERDRHCLAAIEREGGCGYARHRHAQPGAVAMANVSTSLTSGGKSTATRLIISASGSSTMLTTSSPARARLRAVTFGSGDVADHAQSAVDLSENTLTQRLRR
jgi:hypothetical protein